ncbi:hypothetical protein [Levilactobacillus yonginensis]|uniref:hypothetical protein n=1 Tax=Levilactobacillus yonginensis TaxID=1054041 RepID=UPI00345DF8FB
MTAPPLTVFSIPEMLDFALIDAFAPDDACFHGKIDLLTVNLVWPMNGKTGPNICGTKGK